MGFNAALVALVNDQFTSVQRRGQQSASRAEDREFVGILRCAEYALQAAVRTRLESQTQRGAIFRFVIRGNRRAVRFDAGNLSEHIQQQINIPDR